jgi:hypothetical protein
MTYDEALSVLNELAAHHGLRIKTYCLVYLNCLTVPEAAQKIIELHEQQP